MKKTIAVLTISVGVFSAHAEDIRDYYSEPGLNPFKTTMGVDATENINAFSGNLQLHYSDIVIPGNGGLDIEINRVYNNPQRRPAYDDVVGVGWTMHFGRIVVPYQYGNAICGTADDTMNNPSIEHPNGGRELLVLNAIENDGSLISKSNWRARCINSNDPKQGMIATAPDGTEYRMSEYMAITGPDSSVQASWYTKEIRDVHDNTIDITYRTLTGGYNNGRKYIDRISTSDGRNVRYEYIDENNRSVSSSSLSARISKIRAHYATDEEQMWEYRYEPADAYSVLGGIRRYHLTEVIRPDRLTWEYAYNPEFLDGSAGSYSLNHVTYPYGGEVDYTYQLVRFYSSQTYATHAIASKSVSGRQITTGTWTYDFAPGSFDVDAGSIGTRQMDVTTITAPNATHRYYYYGDKYARGVVNLNWTIGLLHRRETMEGTKLIERELNSWSRRQLSTELYKQGLPGGAFDQGTFAAMMTQRTIYRDGTGNDDRGVTDYSDYDAYGNARTVEQSSNTGFSNKTTQLTYFNNKQRWIIGVPEDETIGGVGTVDRTYNLLGDLLSVDRYGVLTSYTYTSEGDLETQTDARGNKTTYLDYVRGTPQLENHEENVDISRIVNNTGTVASSIDGRGYTKSFSYDDLNRLTSIDFPRGADVAIIWHNSGKTLSRGTYDEDVGVDGFGREIRFARTDTSTQEAVIKTKRYDTLGRLVFESYPSTTVNFSNGVRTQYDALDRATRVTHQDGNVQRFNYKSYNLVEEVDERGYTREYLYRSFGHPDNERALIQVAVPVGDQQQATRISRNLLNQVTSVRQGKIDGASILGWTRRYSYDSRTFLDTEEHPETGETHYERDEVGNMSSRRVGDSESTTYAYDKLNRLDTISFPFTQHDVVFEYDKNNNLTRVTKGPAAWDYAFDENNNLLSEELTATQASTTADVNYTKTFQFNYGYTGNDYLKDIVYPSGFTVDYAPNALGRPKQVGTLIDAITYHPNGQLKSLAYANGITRTIDQDPQRLFPTLMTDKAESTPLTSLNYQYDAVGNINAIQDGRGALFSRGMQYDELNRLVTATGNWGSGSMTYNHVGNIKSMNIGGRSTPFFYDTNNRLFGAGIASGTQAGGTIVVHNDDNGNLNDSYEATPFYEFAYDTRGNVTAYDGKTFNYGDDDNLLEVRNQGAPNALVTYQYDGNNYRVAYAKGDAIGFSAYNRAGLLLLENDPVESIDTEYIYLQSQLIAKRDQTCNEALDSDGDSIPDCYENRYGLDPNDPLDAALDNDNDGLTNLEEYTAQTHPHEADTDGDGLLDGVEVMYRLDPLVDDTELDADGDGHSNLEEIEGNSDPQDPDSIPDGAVLFEVVPSASGYNVERTSYPTQSADGKTVYYLSRDGELSAFGADSSDGASLWTYAVDVECVGGVAAAPNGNVYAGCQGGRLYALTADGELLWQFEEGGYPALGPNGRVLFTVSKTASAGGVSTGPAATDIAQLIALEPDGSLAWRYQADGTIGRFTTIDEHGTAYVVHNGITAINADGTFKWVVEARKRVSTPLSLGIDGSIYHLDSGFDPSSSSFYDTNKIIAVNKDGSPKWESCRLGDSVEWPAPGAFPITQEGNLLVRDFLHTGAFSPDGQRVAEIGEYDSARPETLDFSALNGTALSGVTVAKNGQFLDSDAYGLQSYTVDGWKAAILHRETEDKDRVSVPVIAGEKRVFVIDQDGAFKSVTYNESPGDVMFTPWPTVGGNQQRTFYRAGCDGLDNDTDGLPDCYELRIGLDPNNPSDAESDADNDSVNALEEFNNGTHPFSSNSDGDAFPDAYEILFGMDPTSSRLRGSKDIDFDGAETRVEFIAGTSPVERNDAPNVGQLLWRYELPSTLPATLAIADDEGVFVNAAVTPVDYGQYDYVDAPRDSIVPISLFGKTTSLGNCNGVRFNLEFEGFNEIKAIGSKSPSILENGALLYSDRQAGANFSRITLSTQNRPGTGHLNGIPTSAYALGQNESRAYVAVVHDEGLDPDGEELEDSYALRSMSLTNMGTVWSFSLPSAVNGTPAVGKAGNISVGTADGHLITLDADGQELWRYNAGSPLNGHPAIDEIGTVYIGADNGRLYAVNQGVLRWRYETAGKITGSPAIASDGSIYVGAHDGFLHVLNNDGSLRWSFETGGAIQASPTLGVDGMVYFASDDGLVYAIDSAAAAEAANDVNVNITPVWSYDINAIEGMQSSPVLGDDGVLYVASNGGNVYAIYTSSRGLMDSAWPTYGHDSRNTGNILSGSSEPPQLTIAAPTTTNFVEGQAITFEASANDPEDGDLSSTIEWLSDLDGNLGTGAQLVVDMLTVGTHEITARVIDSDGTETNASLTIQVDVTSIIVTLSTSVEDSTIVGEIVSLSASISGVGAQAYEYRFRVKGPSTDDKWSRLRDYAPSNLLEWDTTEYSGENILQVLARPAGSGDAPIKSRKRLAVNEPDPATAVTLSTDVAHPQVSGAVVTATALASGNNSGPFDYQFEIKAPSVGNDWMVIQPYGVSDTVTWNTDQYFGRNVLRVRARKAGTLDKPVQERKPFWINEPEPATKVTLTVDLASPQTAGVPLTLNAAATGGDKGIYEYQFQVRGPTTSGKWEIIQPYSMEYVATFDTTGTSGTYDMRVQAREHGTQDRPVYRRIKNFVIQ